LEDAGMISIPHLLFPSSAREIISLHIFTILYITIYYTFIIIIIDIIIIIITIIIIVIIIIDVIIIYYYLLEISSK